MEIVQSEFNKRVAEIDLYLSFLRQVEKEGSRISFPARINARKMRSISIEGDIKVILKATVFLLLYNLVESTAERSLGFVFETLKTSSLSYGRVTGEVQAFWRKEKLQGLTMANLDKLSSRVHELLTDALNKTAIELKVENVRTYFQGNIDADKLREMAERFGFSVRARKVSKGGIDLATVKRMRNDLAHGNFSFCETGRDYSFDDLEEMKRKVVHFLRDFISSVDRFVSQEQYKAA